MSSTGIDVTEVKSHADVVVTVQLTGGPQVRATYLPFDIVVDWMSVTYRYDVARNWWFALDVRAGGQKVLKPAPDGTRRLGKDRSKANWGGWNRDVQESCNLPDELDKLVSELRPNGAVTLPGV
jgi:hypothetical protein